MSNHSNWAVNGEDVTVVGIAFRAFWWNPLKKTYCGEIPRKKTYCGEISRKKVLGGIPRKKETYFGGISETSVHQNDGPGRVC